MGSLRISSSGTRICCCRNERTAGAIGIATWGIILCGLMGLSRVAVAGTVELKNGLVLEGRPVKLQSITRNAVVNPGPVTIYHIVMVQTDWQRYYVPMRQVPDNGLNLNLNLARNEEFSITQIKQGRGLVVQNVGSIVAATPFDRHGHRTVTLATARGNVPVVQGITKITANHIQVTGLTHVWDFGLGLNAVPQETVISILENPVVCRPNDPQERLARARLYVEAEWYPQAFAELESIARDFPELQERVETFRQELLQIFGRHVLQELALRRKAGQYQLADDAVRKIPQPMLAGSVQREVQQFLEANRRERDDLDRFAAQLGDLQAQLTDGEQREAVSVTRTQLLGELDRSGIDRLRPFLQAANDPQLTPAEKLGLAVSGWALGGEGASTDLSRALRLWEARQLIREYLRAEDPSARQQLYDEIRRLESVGPAGVRQLLTYLPPVLDAETIVPGVPTEITLRSSGDEPPIGYQVVLPLEYSPHRLYPCIVALRPQHKTTQETAVWWAGTEEAPGWAQRRGYIVIAPEYAGETQQEYSYGAVAHQAVLSSLRDARLRFAIDPDRVFLTGHDMGGDAAFDIGLAHPDEFAGVVPIGGVSDHYGRFYLENGQYTSWYIVRGELGRDAVAAPMASLLDRMFVLGAKFDLICVEYLGRGLDQYVDEQPRIFEWMDLHVRRAAPQEFEYRSLRQGDNHPFWSIADPLPRNYVLPQPAGAATGIDVMEIKGRITAGNTVYLSSPASRHVLRLYDGLVDFDRKLTVRVNTRREFSKFVEPDLLTILEDYRLRSDRARIASVVLEF